MSGDALNFGSKNTFYVNKTGLELFDVTRAYGLGIMINGIRTEEIDVTIKDVGYAYIVEAEGNLPKVPDVELFTGNEDKWRQIFWTFKERKDSKEKHPKDDVEEIISKSFGKILQIYRRRDFIPDIGKTVNDGR
ncbi:MAG: hypothetical protein ACP5QI_06460, partial [Candidatus Bathyarchaeia archaeon]